MGHAGLLEILYAAGTFALAFYILLVLPNSHIRRAPRKVRVPWQATMKRWRRTSKQLDR
jgi:hypothetical protein